MFFSQDSPVSSFMKNLPPIEQPKPLRLSEMIDPFASDSFPLVYSSTHDNSFEESWFLQRQENLLPFGYPGVSLECPKVLDLPENPGSNLQLWDWKSLDSIEYEPSTSFNAVTTNTVMPSNGEQPSMRVQNPTENMGFEGTMGSHWNLPEVYPKLNSSMLLESTSANLSNHQQAVSVNDSSSHRFLPGIGLKLDAASIAQCWSSIPYQITSVDTAKDYNIPLQDCSFPSPEDKAKEETNPSSHQKKRKRRKSEQAEAVDSCMRCNCKKSKCLKLYCECFAAGLYCIGSCACKDCENTPNHEETVRTTQRQIVAKNPFAFVPKLIKGDSSSPPSSLSLIGENLSSTPASARHTRGCNCKKSGCSKKYCECYQGGTGCSVNCRCENCKNTFGRKDGGAIATEVKCDEKEETNTTTQLTDKGQLEMSSPNRKRPSRSLPLLSDQAINEQPPCLKESDKDELLEITLQTGEPVQGLSPNKKRVTPPQKSQRLSSSRKLF